MDLIGLGQRRKPLRNSVQKPLSFARGIAFSFFQRLPIMKHLPHILDIEVAKYVWMAADDLILDPGDHVRHPENAFFGRDLRLEHDLQQQISQFLLQRIQIALVEGTQHFVGFLQEMLA